MPALTPIAVGDGAEVVVLTENAILYERSPPGTFVGLLSVTNSLYTWTWTLVDDAEGLFSLDGDALEAGSVEADYEDASSATISVEATNGSVTLSKQFVVPIGDINEAPTDILILGGFVAENAANGAYVGTATAVDPDGDAVFTWVLTDSSAGKFAIGASTGVITKAAALDYEMAITHDITIRVTDAGGLLFEKTITITVQDFDEGQPAAAPANTVLPAISGTQQQGHALVGTTGTWTGNAIPGYLFQWKRGGVAITGATNSTYTLAAADVGTVITLTVTAVNQVSSVAATSAATGTITASGFTTTAYIRRTPAGIADGSSWANAGSLASLPAFISAAAPDTIIYIRADEGLTRRLSLRSRLVERLAIA